MKFAIMIPTLDSRVELFTRLIQTLEEQINVHDHDLQFIELVAHNDNGEKTTGLKRNECIAEALKRGCTHGAFHDDDDLPSETYIQRAIEFMNSGMDCASLVGQIYWNGKPGKPFLHSLEYKEWFEDQNNYYRMPNHLNFVKLDLIKDIKYPDQVFGEDGVWSYAVRDAGVLKTEFKIEEVIYHYFCGNIKHALV